MKKHEMLVQNKAGKELTVSATNFANNRDKFSKIINANGHDDNKLSTLAIKNKGVTNADQTLAANQKPASKDKK